jgi:ribonucleoside-triphosphate reductase
VRDEEWMDVGAWVWKHFDYCSGVSFLPHFEHTYKQAPYQEVEQGEYLELKQVMPTSIDWTKLSEYETEDNTTGTQELSCTADACEIVDIAS